MEQILRTTARTQVTKLIKAANDLASANDATAERLTILLARLKTANENLKAANLAVGPLLAQEHFERECETVLDYDDRAAAASALLEFKLSSLNVEVSLRAEAPLPPLAETSNKSGVKLPKLEMRKFNGDITTWVPFWGEFKTTVHENTSLDGSAKFNYLRSVLTGKAAASIAGFTPTEACYKDAITMLQEEYGSTDRIVEKCMQKLMTTTAVKTKNDISGLRSLYNNTIATMRSLKVLGIPTNEYAMVVKSVLLRSIPPEMRTSFHRQPVYDGSTSSANGSVISATSTAAESETQVQKLLNFIKIEVDALEKSQEASMGEGLKQEAKPERNKWKSTAAGLFTSVQRDKNNYCLFCKSNKHVTAQCNGSLTIEQRKDILKRDSRCYRCTKRNHRARQCRVRNISCEKCKRRHATAMCDPSYGEPSREANKNNETRESNENCDSGSAKQVTLVANNRLHNVHLQTACALAIEPSGDNYRAKLIRIILDGGSQLTFIKECLSRKLNLPIVGIHRISVIPFGSKNNTPARLCNKVELKLINQYNKEEILINAVEVPEICLDTLQVPNVNDPQLANYQLADARAYNSEVIPGISLLIGADQYWTIVTGEVERVTGELVAVNSKLGWTLHGPVPVDNCNVNLNIASVLNCSVLDETLEISKFWDLETIGIHEQHETDEEFTKNFEENLITFKDNRYEALLPWKNEKVSLDNNYKGALTRVKSLETRLLKNSKLLEYDAAMWDYINNGVAEKVDDCRQSYDNDRIYYMPHRPVYRDNSETTKVRVVFDASAHAIGHSSLNDHLLSGTNLIPDLLKVLLNFRVGNVAITADIEKAFLQIALNDNERDCHRFLWYNEPVISCMKLPPIAIYRMKRLTFGVKSSPFILSATILKHLKNQTQCVEICNILKDSFYVDDLVLTVKNFDFGMQLYQSATIIMQRAGMNLRKWHSNDPRLRDVFEDFEVTSKVLGIIWYEVADQIGSDLSSVEKFLETTTQATKRNVLQATSRVFDPLGILGPFTITMKILLQEIWKLKPGWDDVLPIHLEAVWNAWKNQLQLIHDFSVPRCAANEEGELHLFADASVRAYGTVAYLKSLNNEVHLLCAKNRVAPLKNEGDKLLTVPRLELTAAVLGARLANFIIDNCKIKITNVYLWSDSKITLYWIKGNSQKWKSYVANRVREIQRLTKNYEWRYCPGECNPADLLTRGIKAKDLIESQLWIHGPLWLAENSSCWPSDIDNYEERITDVAALKTTVINKPENVEPLFQWEKFSDLKKIVRITAFVLRFLYNLKSTVKKTGITFAAEELNNAELYWAKYAQISEYAPEICSLKNGNDLDKKSHILSLNPFLDDHQIIRVGGRLQNAQLEFDVTHPIILSKNSYLSELLIRDAHNKLHHAGVNAILTKIRERFWIVKGRQLVKSIVSRCVICKRLRGKAASQPFAPLPKERVTAAKPFEITGIDFAGPLYVKIDNELNRKAYIMLFTCAVIRAVHLELIPDLTTESCIRGLRRFMSRRGVPKEIYSDNAKTFKRTAKELENLATFVESQTLQDFTEGHRINWHFIIERAAWWGGWWERMVRTVKTALKSTIGKSNLEMDELQTILIQIEATVNSRPLTYVGEDPEEIQPLTPAHFLLGYSNLTLPTTFAVKSQLNKTEIVALWKRREQVLGKFWKRWSTEYLQQLRSAHVIPKSLSSQLKIGDVVLVNDQGTPRLLWKIGRINQVFPGRDTKIRACEVKLANGKCLRRPVQLLHPLEIN